MRTVSTGIIAGLLGAILVPAALHLGYAIKASPQQYGFAFSLLVVVCAVGALCIRAAQHSIARAEQTRARKEADSDTRLMMETM